MSDLRLPFQKTSFVRDMSCWVVLRDIKPASEVYMVCTKAFQAVSYAVQKVYNILSWRARLSLVFSSGIQALDLVLFFFLITLQKKEPLPKDMQDHGMSARESFLPT